MTDQAEKKVKTSVGLSPQNVKWMKDRHINVSDLTDALITEYREKMDHPLTIVEKMDQPLTTIVKETVRRALARELSPPDFPIDDHKTSAKIPPEDDPQ